MIRKLVVASLLLLPLTALADEPQCRFNAPRDLKLDVAGAKAVVFEVNQHDLVLQAGPGAAQLSGRACASNADWLSQLTVTQKKVGDKLVVQLQRENQGLNWNTGGSNYAYLDLRGTIPANVLVQMKVGSGDASVTGAHSLSADVGSGDIKLRDIKGLVTAAIGSGDVELDGAGALNLLSIGSGDFTARNLRGNATVGTIGSGDLTLDGVAGNVDIKTQFNANLGQPDCLAGTGFYLGLDGNAGDQFDFATTLSHELAHGLGFSALVNTATGQRINAEATAYSDTGLPSNWEGFMYDNTARKTWLAMTPLERRASAVNTGQLAWKGRNAVIGARSTLAPLPVVRSASPAGAVPNAAYAPSTFGPAAPRTGKLGTLATIAPQAGELGPGCSPFNAANAAAVKGKVPIISRGGCAFAEKVKNAQNAGAVAVLLANNAAGTFTPGGADPTVTIPSFGISQADGNALKAAVAAAKLCRSRSAAGVVTVWLGSDPNRKAGADLAGRPLLYTPNLLVPGSSVSHWDVSATPNLLMEAFLNDDLSLSVVPPKDLTLSLLKDLGW